MDRKRNKEQPSGLSLLQINFQRALRYSLT